MAAARSALEADRARLRSVNAPKTVVPGEVDALHKRSAAAQRRLTQLRSRAPRPRSPSPERVAPPVKSVNAMAKVDSYWDEPVPRRRGAAARRSRGGEARSPPIDRRPTTFRSSARRTSARSSSGCNRSTRPRTRASKGPRAAQGRPSEPLPAAGGEAGRRGEAAAQSSDEDYEDDSDATPPPPAKKSGLFGGRRARRRRRAATTWSRRIARATTTCPPSARVARELPSGGAATAGARELGLGLGRRARGPRAAFEAASRRRSAATLRRMIGRAATRSGTTRR